MSVDEVPGVVVVVAADVLAGIPVDVPDDVELADGDVTCTLPTPESDDEDEGLEVYVPKVKVPLPVRDSVHDDSDPMGLLVLPPVAEVTEFVPLVEL
jgi:hypothetical protein